MLKYIKNEKQLHISLLLMFIIGLGLFGYYYHDIVFEIIRHGFDQHTLEIFLRQHADIGAVILLGLISLSLIVPGLPTAILLLVSGVIYGTQLALVINVVGSFLGNLLAVLVFTRLEDRTHYHQSKHFGRFIALFKKVKNPYLALMLGYIVPIIPTSLVNFYVSELPYSLKYKIRLLAVAVLPAAFFYSFGGADLVKGQWMTPLSLGGLLLLIIFITYRLIMKTKDHGNKTDHIS
ncbi:putative membrane protein [Weissella oryzae SG25]|uniref:TVP38/TMEM64 family membrane protein n=2 Tax=Weissella TaxID=46255 RepID=A0A069CUP0_WEIOS|nr:putative membrane protein [Weissella oryzae SG25]